MSLYNPRKDTVASLQAAIAYESGKPYGNMYHLQDLKAQLRALQTKQMYELAKSTKLETMEKK